MRGKRYWRPQLTQQEQTRGWIFLCLYFLVFPFLMAGFQWVMDNQLEFYLSEADSNVAYYLFSNALVLLVFWSYLRNGLDILLDNLSDNLISVAAGLAVGLLLGQLSLLIPLPVEDPNTAIYAQQFAHSPYATVAILVFLMPLVEEVLFRGLVFGSLRRKNRLWGYAISITFYLLYSVWTFAFSFGDPRYLLLAVRTLPAALALTWCYDHGGSIWASIVLHALLNAARLYFTVG